MSQLRKQILFLLIVLSLALPPVVSAQSEIFDGKPAFAEGASLGYYIWKEGSTWSIRWTTRGQLRVFSGYVEAEGGELRSLKRIDLETERRVLYPGRSHVVYGPHGRPHLRGGRAPVVVTREQDRIEKDGDRRIVFTARTNDDIDGFNFKVDEQVSVLHFVLEIDGRVMPQHVEVGRNNQTFSRSAYRCSAALANECRNKSVVGAPHCGRLPSGAKVLIVSYLLTSQSTRPFAQ